MRVVFFGSPVFALPSLTAVLSAGLRVVAAVTQPDRPAGRGQSALVAPPVAVAARELGLQVLQPDRPGEPGFEERIQALEPEAFAVVAYGGLLPDPLLALAARGAWNVHPSLLPRWRGPAPVHRTVWAGDAVTGVSIIRLVRKLDAGPVAVRETVPVGEHETRGELEGRLAVLGARLLVATLTAAAAGPVPVEDQDDAAATYAGRFEAAEREVRWDAPAAGLDRLVRALSPAPAAWFDLRGERIRLLAASLDPRPAETAALAERGPEGAWRVGCGDGSLWVARVQPAGKPAMTMDAFVAGRRFTAGQRLA